MALTAAVLLTSAASKSGVAPVSETSLMVFDFSFSLGSTFQEGFDLLLLIDAFADSPIALQGSIGNGRTHLHQPVFESTGVLGRRTARFFAFREFGSQPLIFFRGIRLTDTPPGIKGAPEFLCRDPIAGGLLLPRRPCSGFGERGGGLIALTLARRHRSPNRPGVRGGDRVEFRDRARRALGAEVMRQAVNPVPVVV